MGQGEASEQMNIHTILSKMEDNFRSIKETTSIDNIDELLQMFEDIETRNYSQLKYVDQLSGEIREIEDEIKLVQNEINKYTKKEGTTT